MELSHCLLTLMFSSWVRLSDFCQSGVPWLVRDVLLIAVENDGNKQKAVDALGGWLHTYRSPASSSPSQSQSHNASIPSASLSPSSTSSSSFTFYRSGSILAALCLDIPLHTPLTSTFTLHVGGLYGLSPNLDIVSVLLQMLSRRGLSTTIADTFPTHSPLSSSTTATVPHWWTDEYRGLVRSMIHHITGETTGFHGHFIANNIDAITLQAVPPSAASSHSQSYQHRSGFTLSLLLSLDAFFHSLNNLVEKLHHSTWLYLLVSPTHFVTMSKYVYAFALLAAPLPLLALTQLYTTAQRWLQAGSITVWLYAIGWSVVGAGVMVRSVGNGVLGASVGVASVMAVLVCGGSVVGGGWATGWRRSRAAGDSGLDWRTLQAIVLLTTFFIVSPLAILNFPLSIALLAFLVPLAIHVRPLQQSGSSLGRTVVYWVMRLSQLVVLLLCSPMTLLVLYMAYWRMGVVDAVSEMAVGLMHLDNVLYLLVPGVYLPVYAMSWLLWLLPASAADAIDASDVSVSDVDRAKKSQ